MKKNTYRPSRAYGILLTIVLIFSILSASIAVPLLWRGFYYNHIDSLSLDERSGYSKAEIREAYDEMMDYCLGKSDNFGTGVMPWSEEGKAHFADCAGLFKLDLGILAVNAVLLVVFIILRIRGIGLKPLFKRGPFFWSGVILAGTFGVIAGICASNFYRAFTTFHHIFFPGKDNWVFDPDTDAIINVLPEEFFIHCAILIVGIMLGICALMIVLDFAIVKKKVVIKSSKEH